MLINDDKKYILNEFLKIIFHISSKDYQKRIWIKAEGPEIDDFTETVCHFFDDGDPILNKYTEYGITKGQYQILKKFRDAFEAFCDGPALEYYLPEKFIDTPEWERIMEMAKEVLKAFHHETK